MVVYACVFKLSSEYLYEKQGTFLSDSFLWRPSYAPSYNSPCRFKFRIVFLEYNQPYLPFCNSAPFCITSSICCVSPDRHRVLWQSMSPSLAISCFLLEQRSSCSLLHSHYLWLMVSCQCMIPSRPGWHIGTFCTRIVLYALLFRFVILGNT